MRNGPRFRGPFAATRGRYLSRFLRGRGDLPTGAVTVERLAHRVELARRVSLALRRRLVLKNELVGFIHGLEECARNIGAVPVNDQPSLAT